MMQRAALLLLLAVVASWVDLSHTVTLTSKLSCGMNFYGISYTRLKASNQGSSVAICMQNSTVDPDHDCLVVEDLPDIKNIRFSQYNNIKYKKPAEYSRDLPNIPANSTPACYYEVKLYQNKSQAMTITLFEFPNTRDSAVLIHPTAAYTPASVNVTAKVNNTVVGSWTISSAVAKNQSFVDLSGCRITASPFVFTSPYRKVLPSGCRVQTCSSSATVDTEETCGIHDICLSNKCKQVPTVCTVTGSTIIDFLNKKHTVTDRCVYSLMKPKGNQTFHLLAAFGERRRQDVVFLDHLILSLKTPGVKIYLEQGGRVRVDKKVLQLNATAQQHHGVALSRDQTGVTAKILSAKMTVFFDGNTAHVSGTDDTKVQGLCGTTDSRITSTLKAEKSSSYSIKSCEIQHNDTQSITSNCTRMTEHCNLMKQAPFTACKDLVDPKPFITACTNTLCKYPAVDGHKCQFFEAYAKTCSMRHNVTLGAWRSSASCPAAHRAVCENQHCSTHEFCGGKQHGGTRCFCRAIFASKYKGNNTFGEPTVCMQNSATLTMAGCLLENQGIDYSVLHLKDQTCTGDMDSQTHMVTFSFNSTNTCGMEVVTNNSQIIYKNTVMSRNSSLYGIITRHDEVQIDFSCYYNQPDMKSVSFKIKDSSVVQKIVSGVWNYTLMMNAYSDPALMNLIKPTTDIRLNQKIWVELKTEGLDGKLVAIVTDSCWATNLPSPNASLRYDLIKSKCANPADQTVQVMGNGQGLSNSFSFNMFEFSGKTSEIYLHCKLELCVKQGKTCVPNCSRGGGVRRRRSSVSKYADENSALITMVWSQ